MFNGFVNFGDIKGECTDADHVDWVTILKYDHAVTQPASVTAKSAGGRTAEEANHSPFSVVKFLDAATPKLYEAACKGTHIPEVAVELWRASGDKPVKYMEFKLKEVLISGVLHNGDPTGAEQFPTETIQMTYGEIEWTYAKQDATGAKKGQTAAKWSRSKGTA